MLKSKKNEKGEMTKTERRMAASAMIRAGYKVTGEKIQKLPNEYGIDIFVCVVGDAMVVYTPYSDNVQFVCF